MNPTYAQVVHIAVDDVFMSAMLELPLNPLGIVLFAHGSGSSRSRSTRRG